MRRFILVVVVAALFIPANSQSMNTDDETLAKLRGLYDAPFTRSLVSFTCDVQFDWNMNFVQTLGAVPPSALPTIERLQAAHHRVFVDRSGATISQGPRPGDLSGAAHAADLENALQAVITSGLNEWLPVAMNEILPVRPTRFTMQRFDNGAKLVMNGTGVAATIMLLPDMRIVHVSGVLPQPFHFSTEFISGPNGYLLQSVKTGSGSTEDGSWDSSFGYQYRNVSGFQIPGEVSVTQQATGEKWDYSLDDCKTMTGVSLQVQAPKH
ncbi:MAG TPA: hypothetical protein VG267_09180 [Terracidiphilus sp.]|nr:hypothetical protein [Terracidiphilus sp.]